MSDRAAEYGAIEDAVYGLPCGDDGLARGVLRCDGRGGVVAEPLDAAEFARLTDGCRNEIRAHDGVTRACVHMIEGGRAAAVAAEGQDSYAELAVRIVWEDLRSADRRIGWNRSPDVATAADALRRAIAGGDCELAESALSKCDVSAAKSVANSRYGGGLHMLHAAAGLRDPDAACRLTRLLLEAGAQPTMTVRAEDAADPSHAGRTSLHFAVESGNADAADMICRNYRGVPDMEDAAGLVPMHLVASDDVGMAETLSAYGAAQAFAQDAKWRTPLHAPCSCGDVRMAAAMLGADAESDDGGWYRPVRLRMTAAMRGDENPFHLGMAATTALGDVAALDLMAKWGWNAAADHAAAAQPGGRGGVLSMAISMSLAENAAVAEEIGPEEAETRMEAVANCIRRLGELGAAPDGIRKGGDRPLHAACRSGHTALISAVLRCGADASLTNGHGETPADVYTGAHRMLRAKLAAAAEIGLTAPPAGRSAGAV